MSDFQPFEVVDRGIDDLTCSKKRKCAVHLLCDPSAQSYHTLSRFAIHVLLEENTWTICMVGSNNAKNCSNQHDVILLKIFAIIFTIFHLNLLLKKY